MSGEEETLQRYFAELELERRYSALEERAAAERIVALKVGYWEALLALPGIARRAVALLTPRRRPSVVTAETMAAADPCCDVADTLVADLPGPAFAVQRARLALVQERQAFARANLRLVVTLANRYRRSGRLALVDLIQEGNVGLLAAIDRFDPARGFRFSTYAAFWIRHALGRALSDRGRIVRLPSHVVELQTKLRSIEAAFEVEHGRRPDADELAQRAGVTVRQVEKLSRVLVERAQPEDDAAELDSLACSDPRAESKIDAVQLERALARALEDLAPIEIEILSLRFGLEGGEGLTLREVGTNYSLSRERVRQIQARALRKLRDDLARRGHDQPAI